MIGSLDILFLAARPVQLTRTAGQQNDVFVVVAALIEECEHWGLWGPAAKETVVQPARLCTLSGDGFGAGPRVAMLPGTW
ncbi:hypothetical protein [Mycobacterium leprae]|uniref:PPW family C-terminal domain-containing PPE protein n=1 Tax=Mycobacterium leprae TaxID=1769 RepID=UPI001E3F0B77|nr:hypothetical protein [Mycobacterium leprae]